MIKVENILSFNYQRNRIEFRGTLINEKNFEIGDKVFISLSSEELKMCCVTVVGKLLEVGDNPSYRYTVRVPEKVIPYEHINRFRNEDDYTISYLKCDSIFNSMEEARQSALDRSKLLYELQVDEINNYFGIEQ